MVAHSHKITFTVDLPYANYGIVVDRFTGVILDAAPMGRWLIGKKASYAAQWAERKGGRIYYSEKERADDDRENIE